MSSKTLIENATEAVKNTVKATKDAAGAATDRINETADRARAAGHEVKAEASDARWLRDAYRERGSLNDVARLQSDRWMGRSQAGG